jgi:hypothetical protein
MTEIYAKQYAPLYECPTSPDSPVIYSYDHMARQASQLTGYIKIKMKLNVGLALAAKSPYPEAVKIGMMKMFSNAQGKGHDLTLEQARIMLGWAARRAQHTGR